MVGGRSYNQSQYNRAIASRRQPGSVFKPFVYLAAFEQAADDGTRPTSRRRRSSTTRRRRGSSTIRCGRPRTTRTSTTAPITFRRALAHSRNLATIQVAEQAGYDHVAELWKKLGVGTPPKAYPSIALGVFEATPFEIATAYTLFPNMGVVRPLRHIAADRRAAATTSPRSRRPARRPIARPDTTFLVTNMMRSVINEGTGAGARAAGFTLDAAGKTGTTNDLRDAWFVGFTPELLTVVWVGFDDNQPVGLSRLAGGAADLDAVHDARARRPRRASPFEVPDGHQLRGHRSRHRQARHARLPTVVPRSVPRRHRADRGLRAASDDGHAAGSARSWHSVTVRSGPSSAGPTRLSDADADRPRT